MGTPERNRENRRGGLFARAVEFLRNTQRNGWRGPVPDEPEVEARQRYRLAGEMTSPALTRLGRGRWGFGLAGDEDGIDTIVTQHAATIRAIHRFGLYSRPEPGPTHRTTPEEEARLEREFFHGDLRYGR